MITSFTMRTVKWWVRYIPDAGIIRKAYRTKRQAAAAQRIGEVIFQVRGHYFPSMAKRMTARQKARK